MAKESPNMKPKAMTPFRKFEQLAKKLMRVPKRGTAKTGDNEKKARTA